MEKDNNVIPYQAKSGLQETDAVRRGAAWLEKVRLRGWPRTFESFQDEATARRIKPSIVAAMAYYEGLLQPPSLKQIAINIEKLETRGFQKPLPVGEDGQVLEGLIDEINMEWVEDLQEYPADLVELACKRWRRSNVNRAPYASGELMESVKAEWVRRMCVYKNAENVLRLIG